MTDPTPILIGQGSIQSMQWEWAMINAVAVAGILTLFQTAPARVEVTPERSEIEVQATAQLSARAFDGSGRAISGMPVRWISSTPELATIDQMGRVLALNPGMARVSAGIGGRPSGSVTIVIRALPAA